jgi:hypothetical protein
MKALKWLGIALGSLIALVIVAAIVVPLVVDVDKYRPQIVEAANQKINGKLEIGKLSLSLWGQIRVQVDGVNLKDSAGKPVLAVKDAYFYMPFLSVLSGSPEMIFKMDHPAVNVIKYKNGKLNAMNLVKSAPGKDEAAAPGGAPTAATPTPGGEKPTEIPAIAARARLGVEMTGAAVEYVDDATGLKSQVKDLNLVIKDLSLTRTMEMQLWADIDTSMAKGTSSSMVVKGPVRMTAHVKPELVGGAFNHATLDAKVDLDGLDITQGSVFHKAKGIAANADLAAEASARSAKIDHFVVKFFNAEIRVMGTVANMGAAPATPGGVAPAPLVALTVESNEIDLKPWNQLVPMLSDYDLAGTAKLDANAQGPSDKLGYKATFAMKGVTAKAPKLKAQPRFDLNVDVVTDEIRSFLFTMKAPANDLTIKGRLVNFAKPVGNFEIASTSMDLDQLVEWPPAPAKSASKAGGDGAAPAAPNAEGGKTAASADVDASLDSLRANPMMANASITASINMKMLKAQGIRMDDIMGKLYFRNLGAGLEGFSLKLWDGTVKANFASQLKPKQPTYTMSFSMNGLDLQKAAAANVEMVKNTLIGKLQFEMNGSGSSFNPEPSKRNLKTKGSFKVSDAKFATLDVMKMASDGINGALAKVAERVPQAKGKTVNTPAGKESKYEWIASSFTIEGGKFKMPDFATKAAPNSGIDLKGLTEVGLLDYGLNTRWEVIDTFDLTGARKVSVDIAGTKVDHLLAEGNGPVKLVVTAGCTCFKPCISYGETPEALAKVALGNVTGAASSRAKAEVQKKVESVIPKSAPPAVQEAAKGLGKKLFGR